MGVHKLAARPEAVAVVGGRGVLEENDPNRVGGVREYELAATGLNEKRGGVSEAGVQRSADVQNVFERRWEFHAGKENIVSEGRRILKQVNFSFHVINYMFFSFQYHCFRRCRALFCFLFLYISKYAHATICYIQRRGYAPPEHGVFSICMSPAFT